MKFNVFLLIGLFSISACSKEIKSNRAGRKMQNFIIHISDYAKKNNPEFIIIPQNGAELLFHQLDGNDELNKSLVACINGIGIESLFYEGNFLVDNERLSMLLKIRDQVPVLVSDFTSTQANYNQSLIYCQDAGFLAFPGDSSNYDYQKIPTTIPNENSSDINSLSATKNYLYLISDEQFADKQSFLTSIQSSNYDLVIIDAFFKGNLLSPAEVNSLKTKANGGKRLVISYINIGAAEKFRYYWQADWKLKNPNWLYKNYAGYEDEIWVKFWKKDWEDIIYGNDASYIKKIIDAGFDGAYLDNVEAYYFLYNEE